VFFEDYVSFTDILTMGSIKEKAMYSFKLLDSSNKGFIVEEDIHKMMNSVFEVWNIMTNSKVVVLPEYVKEVYRQLDKDGDGTLDFEEYQQLYMKDKIVFGWYEYLNQGIRQN
jgi:Ca2+-binding EF-hand superfamily protein